MKFNITWDSSVNAAPAAFKADVLAVANYYANTFSDPVTVNIGVGYGEVHGQKLSSGVLGQSYTWFTGTSYSQLTSALKGDATSTADHSSVASLPANDPTGGGHFYLTTANAKALGLYAGSGMDGYVGFSSTVAMDYDASNGVTAGSFDFFGVVAHEFSEVMGREMLTGETFGSTPKSYSALDLFHYASAGVRTFSGGTTGYFSINGGVTHLQSFNTSAGGDYGDWSSTTVADAYNAWVRSGVVNKITAGDVSALDVIGWSRASTGSTATLASYPASTTVHLAAANGDQTAAPVTVQDAQGQDVQLVQANDNQLVHAHDAGAHDQLLSVGQSFQNSLLVADMSSFYGVA
jgi:hypothetical protein